jgi:hypothetical protein
MNGTSNIQEGTITVIFDKMSQKIGEGLFAANEDRGKIEELSPYRDY